MDGGKRQGGARRRRPGHRRRAWLAVWLAAVTLLAGCAALGTQAPGAGDKAGPGGGAAGGASTDSAEASQNTSEVEGVTLAADKDRYRPGDAITLTVRNDTGAEIQLTGGLGGLKAWRVENGRRQPWEHGMMETGALVPVPAGQSIQLGPIPAPEEPGQYVFEVHFYHQGGGPAAASVTVQVE